MKYLIYSDIHGDYEATKKMIDIFEREKADMMLILGDVLYHGPRNPLPAGHDPKRVAELLNTYQSKIVCVKGNCEAEVDQMVLAFPCLSDYILVVDEGKRLFLTHGHRYTPDQLPQLNEGDIYLYGHTHLWEINQKEGVWMCNPGSIALPKENRPASYAIYDSGKLAVYSLEGEVLKVVSTK